MTTWKTIEEFFKEESRYRCYHLLRDRFNSVCERYDAVAFTDHWSNDNVLAVPDVLNRHVRKDAPDIRCYFDHFYSLKTRDGKIYWIVCPYDHGRSMEEVAELFKANHIDCDIMNGFYADITIVIEPDNLIKAYNH